MQRSAWCMAVLMALGCSPAVADDQPFLTLYTTDIDSQGEREVEQWLGWKTGNTAASYTDLLTRTELEYGLSDDVQGSLYVNYDWSRVRSIAAPFSDQTEHAAGVSGELIYRFLNVYFDPLGAAVYLEPSWSDDEREIETKVLLQKNFFNDTWRCVWNVNFEDDWDRDGDSWDRESALEFDFGFAYNVTPELSASLELDNERAFQGLALGTPARERASAFFLGPTVDYQAGPVRVTFGAQAQLPWSTSPSGSPGVVTGGFESGTERFRLALRLSRDF